MKRILVIDDHEVLRAGIKRIFGDHFDAVAFGEASTAAEGLSMIDSYSWDAVILDLSLGEKSGLEVLRYVKQHSPRTPTLVLSMHTEEQYARRAFRAGASGYITKDSSRGELITALDTVLGGGRYVSPALATRLVIDLQRDSDRPLHESLSDREFEVMRLIASGRTVTQIAATLSLSDKTISTYRARILEKMCMKTNAELTHYTIRNNLLYNASD